jgi:uncharacterized protein
MASLNSENLLEAAREKARELIAKQNRPSRPFRDRFEHTLRVLNWAERLQAVEGGDLFSIRLAVLFHDTGWDPPRPHAEVSAELAETYFRDLHLSEELLNKIILSINNHNLRHLPTETLSIEEKIVMDADLLDEVGVTSLIFDAMSTALEEQASYEKVLSRGREFIPLIEENFKNLKTAAARELYAQRLGVLKFCYLELEYELGKRQNSSI